MRPVIFLNGPPYCGKDTLANHIAAAIPGFKVVKFAAVLKERTHALYGRSDLPYDHFELTKDMPSDVFMGLTPREAYIAVSENLMKPIHGKAVFGKLLTANMKLEPESTRGFLISDSGFSYEAYPVLKQFGSDNCVLVRIHAEGRGCTFEKDSRSYIELPVKSYDIDNNDDKNSFLSHAKHQLANVLQSMIGAH